MGKRTSYPAGTFSWVDLGATDGAAAGTFYAGVFGWELEETDTGGGPAYTVCQVDGDAVCGLYELPEEMRGAGVSPNWTSYVTVDDADAVVARAREVGGDVVEEAFDVLDFGRTAVLKDQQGAAFAVWQPGTRIGAERVNDVGCLCMNELSTTDLQAARSFYEHLFGWRTEISDAGGPSMVFNGGNVNAAMFSAPDGTPAYWRACFTVESTEDAVKRVRELGGEPLTEPLDIGHGSIAMLRDPEGCVFTVFAGETHP